MAKKLDTLLKPLVKSCTRLLLRADRSAKGQSAAAKFGGVPYLEQDESWPACTNCGSPLVFIAQFNLAECPHPGTDKSLYVFYYCMECFPWGHGDAERGQWTVRRYPQAAPAKLKVLAKVASNPEYSITPCTVAYEAVTVLPDWEEIDSEAIHTACTALDPNEPWEAYAAAGHRLGCLNDSANLVGGYPSWIQGRAEKICPHCGERMDLLIQIDSDDNAKLMWGDMGLIYLFQCRHHPDSFALELQCY